MKRLSTIILLLLIFGNSIVCAQEGILKGKVIDQATGEPIAGASVFIKTLNKGTSTNADGTYRITNIPLGEYKVAVSFIGYELIEANVAISNEQEAIQNFQLQESTLKLQDIEIVGRKATDYKPDVTFAGTRTGLDIKLVPQSIAILNKELLIDQQIFRIADISDNIAGVTRTRVTDNFTSRGFRINHNYINGNRALIGTDFASSTITSHYERVEVVKGPAAALFGNGSPGGIINTVTKKPLSERRAYASFSGGSFGTRRATFDITGPLNENKQLLYRLNAGWENAESFRDFQRFRTLLLAPSISFIPNDKTAINVDLVSTFANDDAGVDRGMPMLQGDLFALPIGFNTAEPYDNRQNTSILFTVSANHKFTESLSFNVSYTRSDFDQNFIETRSSNMFTDDGTELVRTINDRITDGKSDFVTAYLVGKFELGSTKHEAIVGFDYFETLQDSRTRAATGEINGVPNLSFNNRVTFSNLEALQVSFSPAQTTFINENSYQGFYFQDLINWNRLNILLGLRYENLDQNNLVGSGVDLNEAIDDDVILPRLGITYQLNKAVNLFFSYTESFDLQAIPSGVNALDPGMAFDPLASDQIEFGTKTTLFKDKLLATVSIYFINRSGRLIEDPQSGGGLVQLIQIGDETSRGVELDFTGRISNNLSLTFNYAFNDVDVLDDQLEVQQLDLEANNPEHAWGFWGKYSFDGTFLENLSIGIGGRYVSSSQVIDPADNLIDNVITFPSYFTAKAGIFYAYKDVRLSLNINNIFDERYFVGGLNAGRVFPGAPRNYLATIAYSF